MVLDKIVQANSQVSKQFKGDLIAMASQLNQHPSIYLGKKAGLRASKSTELKLDLVACRFLCLQQAVALQVLFFLGLCSKTFLKQ